MTRLTGCNSQYNNKHGVAVCRDRLREQKREWFHSLTYPNGTESLYSIVFSIRFMTQVQ